jgi:hypothetical protein
MATHPVDRRSGWSVRLLLTKEESVAMSRPELLLAHPDLIRMSIGGYHADEVEETPFVTVEMIANDAESAEKFAQQYVAASLKPTDPKARLWPVVWAAPLSDKTENSHRFLEQAKELFASEEFDLAIVAAQIHFEIQLRLLLKRAAARADNPWATRLAKSRGAAALAHDVSKASVHLLLGIDVTESRYWPEFEAHRERRNAVVHEGRSMGSKEAAESIKVVQALWAVLAEAERASTLF